MSDKDITNLLPDGEPEERLWAAVLNQAKEDLESSHKYLTENTDSLQAMTHSTTEAYLRVAWHGLRATTLFHNASGFFTSAKEGEQATQFDTICAGLGCSPCSFLTALGDTMKPPADVDSVAQHCVEYLDRVSPGWRENPGYLPEGKRDILAMLAEEFPEL